MQVEITGIRFTSTDEIIEDKIELLEFIKFLLNDDYNPLSKTYSYVFELLEKLKIEKAKIVEK